MTMSRKKRYIVQGGVAASLLGLGAAGVVLSLPAEAGLKAAPSKQGGGEQPEALAPDTYLGVQRLRQELCLSGVDLAAMGCDTATAKTLMERAIALHEAHRADVIAARNAVLSAKTSLYRAQRDAIGEEAATDAELRTLREDYDSAVTAYHTLLEGLADGMSAGLTADQQALWRSARAAERDGRPQELRYAVDLTAGQLEDIRDPGTDAQGNPRTPVEAADLRLMQEESIEQARSNRAAFAGAVALAEEDALPVPPELVEDEAGFIDPPETPEE